MEYPHLELAFRENSLFESWFSVNEGLDKSLMIRGKKSGAYLEATGFFQWTKAVRALSCLLIKYKLSEFSSDIKPLILGGKGSLASSLDYSMTKQPLWLCDMFGLDYFGRSYSKRILRISNSNRKRPGPVAISVNSKFLSSKNIKIYSNGTLLETEPKFIQLLKKVDPTQTNTKPILLEISKSFLHYSTLSHCQ